MRLRVNGLDRELPEGLTLVALVQLVGAHPDAVAIAHNGEVVPRSQHDRGVHDGDTVEIIRAVGGG
ncbi:MAG: sulfur carrier protein ThiS [Myxococcales bacterium]|nr:sulfur carrier protein ThiS [Myxococcales bacterium]